MKNLILVILLTTFSFSMFAGWDTNQRSKCRWYAKKYAVNARVFTGLIAASHNGHCENAYAEVIKQCAWQQVRRNASGVWEDGGVNNSFCSRGEKINTLESILLPYSSTNNDYIEKSSFTSDNAHFDEASHSIKINNMSGYIKLKKGNGYFSNIRLSIWRPNDDHIKFIEDEKMDESEVLNQFEIRVDDKGLTLNGNLINDDLKNKIILSEINGEYYVKFENLSINIPIDSNISLDDLAVRFDGDGAPDKIGNLNNSIANTESELLNNNYKFVLFPNPSNDIVNVEFTNNLANGNVNIEIYNSAGEKVKTVFDGNLSKNEPKTITVDISNLLNDSYFVLINCNGSKLIKQLNKN